ncbi:MAG: DUF4276 family protein [Prevotellaceae bacterium]|jgi:hypothetical protein|nr:DUF4276 family protein [Prevotellaceae bacterium]
MRRIIIICEGETEQAFCKTMLNPYFAGKGLYIQSPLIKQTRGGITNWSNLKAQIENYMKEDRAVFVSLLIDYYGIEQKHNFPAWEESLHIVNKNERLDFLEQKMQEDIAPELRHRFIPYMQLHEFEGLLFNHINIFHEQIPAADLVNLPELQNTFEQFSNPEMINDCPETVPSKRLGRIIRGYNKIVYGNILAEAIGLVKIRNKCQRFNAWIGKIESKCTT